MRMRRVKIKNDAQSVKEQYRGKKGRLADMSMQNSDDYYLVEIYTRGLNVVLVLKTEVEFL